jgi:hypothetical protein
MKINGTGPVRATAARRKDGADATGSGGFAAHMNSAFQSTPAAVSGASQIGSVGALLALQSGGDASQGGAETEINRAEDILDRLDQIRVGILTVSLTGSALTSIVTNLNESRRDGIEPRLAGLIDEIELRARVELARLSVI